MKGYEKQMQWKQAATMKAATRKMEEEQMKHEENMFTPHLYTVPVKEFEGSAREVSDRSSYHHIGRQERARKEKKKIEDRQSWQSREQNLSSKNLPQQPPEIPTPYMSNESDLDDAMPSQRHDISPDQFAFEENEEYFDSEPIVELLERERREWKDERMKLIQCIHLQQLELAQRSVAAHERATDIAKEFARAIEGFEERLVSVETNVQKEIMAIKVIAESLRAAVVANGNGAFSGANMTNASSGNNNGGNNTTNMGNNGSNQQR